MLCATDPDGRAPFRSACTGDSGGPLVAGSTLAGIVSWGLRCGGDKDPTVFTDPAAYRGFLTAAQPVARAGQQRTRRAADPGEAKVGAKLTCQSPPWIRQPDRITFSFDSYRFNQGRETRQQGSSATYVVRTQDAGRLVSCLATGLQRRRIRDDQAVRLAADRRIVSAEQAPAAPAPSRRACADRRLLRAAP